MKGRHVATEKIKNGDFLKKQHITISKVIFYNRKDFITGKRKRQQDALDIILK